jgi:Sulfotransferase family
MHAEKELTKHASTPTRPWKWTEKVSREIRRLTLQANTLFMRPLALTTQSRFLFILGHMRSGSSLLSHLLCSSDDIVGFGEAHNDYRRRSDLAKLLAAVRRHTGENPLRYRYVLDKIVSAERTVKPAVLSDSRIRYVFLVREPVASIASVVAMRHRYYHEDFEQHIKFATAYYSKRLAQLVELAQTIGDPERCVLLTYRQLLGETPAVFEALEQFLELSVPLREEYKIMPTTGQPVIGDPSPGILKGRIDRSLPRKHFELPANLRHQMVECHANCLERLREAMPTPVPRSAAVHNRLSA